MASSITLSTLRSRIRARGEFEDDYHPDADVNADINDSLAALHDLIISVDDSRFLSEDTISVTSGTASYSLPSDYYILKGVSFLDDSSNYRVMDRFSWDERNDYHTNTASKENTRYEVRYGKLWLSPTPTWSGTIKVAYIPTATSLSQDSDTWDSINVWTEWVVLDVLIKCALKEESDISGWLHLQKNCEKRIKQMGKQDKGQPMTVANVYRSNRRRFHWSD